MARFQGLPLLASLPLLAYSVVVTTGCGAPTDTGGWTPGPGLKTRWAAEVDPTEPLPEYPRPQMVRGSWRSLNGIWELAVLPGDDPEPEVYPSRILVPYPVESALSGVAATVDPTERVWYRRTFSLPHPAETRAAGVEDSRWLLHFGAVDWDAEVFLNGRRLGGHRGGYTPFSFDITDALVEGDRQEVVVAVRDPTDRGSQPRGKQVLDPRGIWYTAVTGIWQTVWLEPVPDTYIAALRMDPDLERGTLTLTVDAAVSVEAGGPGEAAGPVAVAGPGEAAGPVAVAGPGEAAGPVAVTEPGEAAGPVAVAEPGGAPQVRAVVLDGGTEVARGSGEAGRPLTLTVPAPRPWSPADPFLYDLRVELEGGDVVESYFGMRSIAVGPDDRGRTRLLLNGEPVFQYGLLDQGWWPGGLYTAPTDVALRFDVARSKALGFNLIRKHVKVEPARWYHHADREGILVWQDMPSGSFEGEEAAAQYARELGEIVTALGNHPSIVMWVPFNEGWGQHETESTVAWLREEDPTRLVNNASGWTDRGVGDVLDIHRYPGPDAPALEALGVRAPVLGEFGGLGLPLPGHTWVEEENWGYRSYGTVEELNQAYADLLFQLRPLVAEGLAAAVYTQTTDVEIEVNGVMTYDREVVKLSEASISLHAGLYGPQPELREVVPTSREVGQPWRHTTEDPGQGWFEPGFDDGAWASGPGGFGTRRTPGARVGTVWETPDLWIRRSFRIESSELAALSPGNAFLRVHHDEDAEVFLNGHPVATLEGFSTGYRLHPLAPEDLRLLVEGENTLAVHVRQTDGGQFIDVGLVEWRVGPGGP